MSLVNLLPISIAHAAEGAAPASPFGGYEQIFLLVGFVAIFYFLIIRPQSKRSKQHKRLISAIGVGDEVITSSGFMGKIVKVNEDSLDIELAENLTVKLQKSHITANLPKGTIKAVK